MMMAIVSAPVSAHPHAWIDVKTTLILTGRATVTAVREQWSFDASYSNTLLKDGNGKWKPLKPFVQTAMRNLAPYGYFMELHARGARLAIGRAGGAEGEVRNGSLIMRFTVSLSKPIDISHSDLSFSVYDPSYFIAFEHVKDHPIAFEGPGVDACTARIRQAKPSFEALSQAQAMDRNAPVNPELGRLFAETVLIHC